MPLYITGFLLFYILYVEKFRFNAADVVRRVYIKSVWKEISRDLIYISMAFSLYITVITGIFGFVMTGRFCNWNEFGSVAANFNGQPIEKAPNFFLLLLVFFISLSTFIFVMGNIMLIVWWFTKKQWAGYIVALVVTFLENRYNKGILLSTYELDGKIYRYGINIITQLVYPVVLSLLFYIVVRKIIRRRDFLN